MNDLEGVRVVRRLRQQSGNLMITLPRKICRILGLTSGNYLSVRYEGTDIIISRVRLAQDGAKANEHHRTPAGPHGNWVRKEQAAQKQERGE